MASAFAALFLHLAKTSSGDCNVILHAGRRPWVGSPPGRPIKRQRANFAGPVPECVHINKRITAAQSAEVRQYFKPLWAIQWQQQYKPAWVIIHINRGCALQGVGWP